MVLWNIRLTNENANDRTCTHQLLRLVHLLHNSTLNVAKVNIRTKRFDFKVYLKAETHIFFHTMDLTDS